jgi:hypothetical protein
MRGHVEALGSVLETVVAIALMVGFIVAPFALLAGLLFVARRRLQGRRGKLDGLFSGMARANAAQQELVAGIPPAPDLPEPPGGRRRRRRHPR